MFHRVSAPYVEYFQIPFTKQHWSQMDKNIIRAA